MKSTVRITPNSNNCIYCVELYTELEMNYLWNYRYSIIYNSLLLHILKLYLYCNNNYLTWPKSSVQMCTKLCKSRVDVDITL